MSHLTCTQRLFRIAQFSKVANAFYALVSFSLLLFWFSSIPLCSSFVCGHMDSSASQLFVFYFWSKLWEGLIDLPTCSLRFPVNAHFRVHHYTTPIFAYLGMVTLASHAFVFMGLNLFMHVMVYAFHAGFQPNFLLRAIRFWQNVQLLGGIFLSSIALAHRVFGNPCSAESFLGDVVPPILFGTYYWLFQLELREAKKM